MEWAKVELMGHRVRVGRVCEVERFGGKLLQIEPIDDDGAAQPTELYGSAAIFCVTYTTEAAVQAEVDRVKAERERYNAWQKAREGRALPFTDEDAT